MFPVPGVLVGADGVVLAGYLVAFAAAAVLTLASAVRVSRIDHPDTRRGLVALLLTSSGWAVAHLASLIAPSVPLKHALYLAGLVVGLSTVGAWLYFCSAYTNRSLHRNATLRRVALGLFLAVVAVKVTNPLHGLYFTAEFVESPFPHLAVTHQPFHWLVMGLSYSLALVGYFMLFEYFRQVSYDTRPLLGLVGITGLPILLDVVGFATPYLVDITYEPIGVAVFAAGVAFVYLERFRTIRLAGSHDDPLLVVSEDDRIRDYNEAASDLFPELADSAVTGEPFWATVSGIAEQPDDEPWIVEVDRDDRTGYYRVSETPFSTRQTELGRLLVFTDITDQERSRRELERQNERLEQFASMVSHDLRNPLNVAVSRLELARDDSDSEHLEIAGSALERMEGLIEDVLALARHGQPIEETEVVSLSAVATRSWGMIDAPEAELVVDRDLRFRADAARLQQSLENLFRNAVEHGGAGVTIRVGALKGRPGFYVADDGSGIPEGDREELFTSGYSTSAEGTGFGLAIVRETVEAHGWTVTVGDSESGGARFEITGVEIVADRD